MRYISYADAIFKSCFSSIVKRAKQIFIFRYDITFHCKDNIIFPGKIGKTRNYRRSITHDVILLVTCTSKTNEMIVFIISICKGSSLSFVFQRINIKISLRFAYEKTMTSIQYWFYLDVLIQKSFKTINRSKIYRKMSLENPIHWVVIIHIYLLESWKHYLDRMQLYWKFP